MGEQIITEQTFADGLIYDGKKKNFLILVEEFMNWSRIKDLLEEKLDRKKKKSGEQPYPVLVMFKALLLQSWYKLSDPGLEEALIDRQSFWKFTGLSASSKKPDETSLCRFRNLLLKHNLFESLLFEVNHQISVAGFKIKEGSIVDASLIKSSRRPRKVIDLEKVEEDRQEQTGSKEEQVQAKVSYSKDKDAKWIKKGNQTIYGYKVHAAVDQDNGFILGGVVTGANQNDGKLFSSVIDRMKEFSGKRVFADKGYPFSENKKKLKELGIKNGIMDKAYKNKPLSQRQKQRNRIISTVRYKVERAFGTLKKDYDLTRTRYLGCQKTELLFYLNSMAFNLKKVARLCS